MAERKPDVIRRMVMLFHGTNPDSPTGKLVASGLVQQRTDGMIAALRFLQNVLRKEFDGQAEPSDAIGILIARHQAGVDEETECNQTPPHTRDIQPDEES